MTGLSAEYFDQWYADMASAGELESAKRAFLGLPPELGSASLLTMDGLREIAATLALQPGETLLDLACGRGGYGLWLARVSGCRIVGVDFSAVAIDAARAAVPEFGLEGRAEFRTGELEATGLPDASVDGIICVDAIQFAGATVNACAEMRRVLRPGGRLAVTCWEGRDREDALLPERLRELDLAAAMTHAGLVDVVSHDRASWLDAERSYWKAAVGCDPAGDPALQSWHEEGRRMLPSIDRVRRVLVTASVPT